MINITGYSSCTGLSYNQVLDVLFDDSDITEPVTLAEAKNFCKIDIADDDTLITALIIAARKMCESYTNIGFVEREVTAVVNNGNGNVYLPYGPIGDVSLIDDVAPTDGQIVGFKWKQLTTVGERITLVYTAGYAILPEDLKTGLLNAIYFLYDNRAVAVDGIGEIAKKILKPQKRVW
jgi:hypothetical protein